MKPLISSTFLYLLSLSSVSAIDFLFNSFNPTTDLILTEDARIDSSVIRLTNDSNQFSIGRAFFRTRLPMAPNNNTTLSFSTSFIFSILPQISSSPGFGLTFVLSNTTSPPGAISGQYFGIFSNAAQTPGPLLAIEFDTGQNPEFNDPDGNHVGIDLNYIESAFTHTAGYYRVPANNQSVDLEFVPIDMRSGRNIRAWIEFDGPRLQINVTIAPAGELRPPRPLISYTNPEIASYMASEAFVGFSASKVKWVEAQRILAWSLSDTGAARELNTSNLPTFFLPQSPSSSSSSSLSAGLIAGIVCAVLAFAVLCFSGFYYYSCCYRMKRLKIEEERTEEEEDDEEWDLNYFPRRFSYEDLWTATNGFSKDRLLGFGVFGKVYKGVLPISISRGIEGEGKEDEEEKEKEVAVKCVSHNSKQGVREFMAEISSMGRLEHKSLIHMKGWCRKGTELMLVYEYMPNGSLNRWIFRDGDSMLGWAGRRRILTDVAEALLYLHQGWDQVIGLTSTCLSVLLNEREK